MIDNSIDIFNERNGKISILLFDELNEYNNISNKVNNWKDISDMLINNLLKGEGEILKYDLHVHTTCSDGKYSRLEMLKKANDSRLRYMCFADHNYINNDIKKLNKDYIEKYNTLQNVKLFNATELDIEEYSRLHILGYDLKKIDIIEKRLSELEQKNTDICKKIVKKINDYYSIDIQFKELANNARNGVVTKKVIEQWLINNGYASNIYDAGMKYTSRYSPCYVKRSKLCLEETIYLIKKSNGLVFMAHPSSLKMQEDELYKFIRKLKEMGLDGIEVFNADKANEKQIKLYRFIADKLDLLQSSGSDFHSENETPIFGVNNEYSNDFIKILKRRS